MRTTKLKVDLKHNPTTVSQLYQTTGTITIEPGDRLTRLLEIVDGLDPEQVKAGAERMASVLRMVGGFLGIRSDGDGDKTDIDIEGDDGDAGDSGPHTDRAANLV